MSDKSRMLRIDPTKCDGAGICAELLPGHIHLDDWGFPVVHAPVVDGADLAEAARARRACPRLAISLKRRPK